MNSHRTSRQTHLSPTPSPIKSRLSVDEMMAISFRLGAGQSIRETATQFTRSPTTVSKIRKRATNGGSEEAPRINYVSQILRHFIAFCLFENPSATGRSIGEAAEMVGLKVSRSTVNRLAKEMQFTSLFAQRKEFLTPLHKAYRVFFARNIRLWEGFKLPWIFTDETMLVLNPVRKRVRVIRGVESADKFVEFKGYPVKVMVWGAIGPGFKSPLLRIEGTLTADGYQKLLTSSEIFSKIESVYGKKSFVFQQDGARPHTAISTRNFLRSQVVTLPDHLHWPAMSPDLSVIENLWSILKYGIVYSRVTDGDSLFAEACRVWNDITLDVVNNTMSDFVPRLQTCQMINGECLNGYKAVVRGFRQSEAQGIKAAQTFFQEQTSILSFRERSSSFFRQLDGAFTNVGDEQEDDARQCQLYLESLEVCGSLPPRIRAKTGLGTQSGGQV